MTEARDTGWNFVGPETGFVPDTAEQARIAQGKAHAEVGQRLRGPAGPDDLDCERDDAALQPDPYPDDGSWRSPGEADPGSSERTGSSPADHKPRIMPIPDASDDPSELPDYGGIGTDWQQRTDMPQPPHVRIFSIGDPAADCPEDAARRFTDANGAQPRGYRDDTAYHDGGDTGAGEGNETWEYGTESGRVDLADHTGQEGEQAGAESDQQEAAAERDRAKVLRQQLGRAARATGRVIADVSGQAAEAFRDGPGLRIGAHYYAHGVLRDEVAQAKRQAPFGRRRAAAQGVNYQASRIMSDAKREYLTGNQEMKRVRNEEGAELEDQEDEQ